jgi:bifunctional non-homologous end joining protein LigD
MASHNPLERYQAKRDFSQSPEPSQGGARSDNALTFVVQKHAARNLHYDFRLELQGTLKSWAVPKGPSLDPGVKRMGVHVEDHPISYAGFEGTIPPQHYGAGDVIVWDRGLWTPTGDPVTGLESGKLKFELHGEKLKGGWTLVRMQGRGDAGHEPWLLIKERDSHARPEQEFDVLQALPDSVLTGLPLPGQDLASAAAKTATTRSKTTAKKSAKKSAKKALPETKPAVAEPNAAVSALLPETLSPQLATLVTEVPADPQEWIYEIKFDGYRVLSRIDGASVKCLTRSGNDWTKKLPKLARSLGKLGIGSGWLDGEIVVLNAQGLPDFGALQNAFDSASTASIVYYVFDLPFHQGLDLRQVELVKRREILKTILTNRPQADIRFSEAFKETPQDFLDSARRIGLEGIVGKRQDSGYGSGRSADWIKLKSQLRQEFVIGGYTEPKGSRSGIGALLLGFHDADGKLRYAGNVGTGFDNADLHELKARLSKIHAGQAPFAGLPSSVKGQWIKPKLLAEVAFGEWTRAGRIRHAVFQGLRTDKPAKNIVRESSAAPKQAPGPRHMPQNPSTPAARSITSPAVNAVRITHGDRVIDASTGFTKKDLIEYYATVARLMLPHLKARPAALVRAPAGITGELFFQKHAEAASIPGIKLLDPALDPGHAPLLEIVSAQALLAAAQFNVVEFHTWNATSFSIGKPDRMTFDLDPGDGVGWPQVQEAAQLVKTVLDELGLVSFLKTSGGKGLHVVVPLKRHYGFDAVKDFSHAVVTHLATVVPQRFVVKSGPKNRIGKIFVDYLRNGFGATTVTAWSMRARPGMGISVPVGWDELASLTSSAHWTARTLGARLATGNQPWSEYELSRQGLAGAMKKLGFKTVA